MTNTGILLVLLVLLVVAALVASLLLGARMDRARLTRGGDRLFGRGRHRLEKLSGSGRLDGEVLVGVHRTGEVRVRDYDARSSHPAARRLTAIYVPARAPALAILPRGWETDLLLSRRPWFRAHATGVAALDQALAVHVDDPAAAQALLGRAELHEALAHLAAIRGFLGLEACPGTEARLLSFTPAHLGLEAGIGIEIHGSLDAHLVGQASHAIEALDRLRRAVSP